MVDRWYPFTFHTHPFGPHSWSGLKAWGDSQVLQLHRDGDPYPVWELFRGQGTKLPRVV